MQDITKLDVMTDAIMALESISHRDGVGPVIYDLEQGEVIAFTLKSDRHVHIVDAMVTQDTIFPLHKHPESFETLILQKGEATLLVNAPGVEPIRHEMVIGEPFGLPAGIEHLLHAKKTCWIIGILIPPDEGVLK